MKRPYLMIAAGLIAVGILCDWRLSLAVDPEQPVSAVEAIERSETAKLVARIEALEKRVSKLERSEQSLVRQADSRGSELDVPPTPIPPKPLPRDNDQRNKEEIPRQTNGQTWRFRLLGDTQPAPRNAR